MICPSETALRHFRQPMQAARQYFRFAGAFSFDEQSICVFAEAGTIFIIFFGQTAMHLPQPEQSSA